MPKDNTPKPTVSTTQNHLDIEDIVQDIIILKDGSACLVLEVSALNFGLLSETEQEATIFAYAQLLNSLTFSVQIVVASKQKDVSDYLALLDKQLTQTTGPLIRDQLAKYRDFVKTVVRQGNVLDKKFYVVIPFSSLELGVASTMFSLGSRNKKLPIPKKDLLVKANMNLSPKRDHLVRLLARIGLRARQLNSTELLQIFFDSYNHEHLGTRVSVPPPNPAPVANKDKSDIKALTSVQDILAPETMNVDFNTLQMGDTYFRTLLGMSRP
jgi:hypothetical protein